MIDHQFHVAKAASNEIHPADRAFSAGGIEPDGLDIFTVWIPGLTGVAFNVALEKTDAVHELGPASDSLVSPAGSAVNDFGGVRKPAINGPWGRNWKANPVRQVAPIEPTGTIESIFGK